MVIGAGVAFSLPFPLTLVVLVLTNEVGRGAKAGISRTVGERERDWRRRGRAVSKGVTGTVGFDTEGPGASLSESEDESEDEEEEDEEEEDEDAVMDNNYI